MWLNMPQLKLGHIQEHAPGDIGDIPQFLHFAIYIREFSFLPE